MSRTKTSTIALRTTKITLDLFKNIKSFANEDYIYNLREDNLIKKILKLLLNQYFSININKLQIIKYFESVDIFTELNIDKNTQKLNLLKFINEKNINKKLSLILYNKNYLTTTKVNKKKLIIYNNLIAKQLYNFKIKKLILNKLLIFNYNNKSIILKKQKKNSKQYQKYNINYNYTLNIYNIYYYFIINILKNINIIKILKNKNFIYLFFNIFSKIQNLFFKNNLNYKILKNKKITNNYIKPLLLLENNTKILNKTYIQNIKNNLTILFQLIFNYYKLCNNITKNSNKYKIFYKFLINDLIIIYLNNSNYSIKKNITNYINIYIKNYYIILQFKNNIKLNYFSLKYLKTKLIQTNKIKYNNIKVLLNKLNTNINTYNKIEIIPTFNNIKKNTNNLKLIIKPKNKYFQINLKNRNFKTLKKNQIIIKNKNKYYKIFILKTKKIKNLNKRNKKFKNKFNLIKKSNILKNLKLNYKNLNYYLKTYKNYHIKYIYNSSIIQNVVYNKSLIILQNPNKIKNLHKFNNNLKIKSKSKKKLINKIKINTNFKIKYENKNNYKIVLKPFIKTKYTLKVLNLKYVLSKQLKIKKFIRIHLNYFKRQNLLELHSTKYIYRNKLLNYYYLTNKKQFICYNITNKQIFNYQLKVNNKYLYKKQCLHRINLNTTAEFYNKIALFNYYLINSNSSYNEISRKIYFDINFYFNNIKKITKNQSKIINKKKDILIQKYLNNKILLLNNLKYNKITLQLYLKKFNKKNKSKKHIKNLLHQQYGSNIFNFKENNNKLLKKFYLNKNIKLNTKKYYHLIFKLIYFNKNINTISFNNNFKYYIILNNLLKIKNNYNISNFISYYNNIKILKYNNILSCLYLQKLLTTKKNNNNKYKIINYNIIYNYFNSYNNIKININNNKLIYLSYKNFIRNPSINLKKFILKNNLITLNYTTNFKKFYKKIYNFKTNLKIKNILVKQLYSLKYLYLLNKFNYSTPNLSFFDLYDYQNLKKKQLIKLFLDFNFLNYSKSGNNIQLFENLIYPLFNKYLQLSYKKQIINVILNFEQIFKIITYFKNLNNIKIFSKFSLINNNKFFNNISIKNNYINLLTNRILKNNNIFDIYIHYNKFQKYSKNFEIYKNYIKKTSIKYNRILAKKQLVKNYTDYKFNKSKIKKSSKTINNLLLFYNFLCIYKYQKYLIKKILKKTNFKINTSNNFYFIQKKYIKYLLLNNYIKIYNNLNSFFILKLTKNQININKGILYYNHLSLNSNNYYYTDLLNIFNKNNILINNTNEYNLLYPDLLLTNSLNKINYNKIKNLNQQLLKASTSLNTNIITNNYLKNLKYSKISKIIDYYYTNNTLYINNNIKISLINKLLNLHKKHLNKTNLLSLNLNINNFFYTIIKNYYLFSNKLENKFINKLILKKNILLNYILNKKLYVNLYENQQFIDIKKVIQNTNLFLKYLCFLNIYYIISNKNYIKFYNNYNIFSLLFFSNFLDYIFKKSNYLQFLFYKLSYKNNNLSKIMGLYLLLYQYNNNPKLININIILNYICEFLNSQIKSNTFYKFSNLKKNLYLFENIFNDFIKIATNITGIQFSIKGKTSNTTLRKKKYIIQKGYLNLNNITNLITYSQKIVNGKYGKLCFRLYISTNILQ